MKIITLTEPLTEHILSRWDYKFFRMNIERTTRLVQAVQELSLARSLDEVMAIVRTVARALTGADGATFVLRDNDMSYYADEDAISPLWKGRRFPMSTCISGWAMLNKKAAVIEDIYQDGRVPHDAYQTTFVKSLLMVPIRTLDPIGAIGNYWATPHVPTEEEITFLQSLADITAVTLDNVDLYQALEQRVKDRTAELEISNRKLGEAYRELESFSYSVSHDLKTPLRAIISFARALHEDQYSAFNNRDKQSLDIIIRNADNMNLLIDDILRFSRLVQYGLNKSAINLNEQLTEIIRALKISGSDTVDVVVHPLPSVTADRALLSQVWTNLISNAIKYSAHQPKPHIEVDHTLTEDEIVFSIKDNGVGFDMKYADKLFGVFQRLHSDREFKGTGIGLALVKRIVTRHGGKVWANGQPKKGATFYFSLPRGALVDRHLQ